MSKKLKTKLLRQPRNKFETKLYTQLRRAKVLFKYESEKIPYILARHYVPDFIIETANGKIYIEAKGYLRTEDKAKMRAVKKLHPAMDLRIVFYSYKQKDIRWSEKNNIPWALERIPKEWITTKKTLKTHTTQVSSGASVPALSFV